MDELTAQLDTNLGPWRKSSRSEGTADKACVEIAFSSNATGVRDSKNPNGGALVFGTRGWDLFLSAAKRGEFGLASE